MLKTMTTLMFRLGIDEKGASAVEYAILVGAVGSAVIAAVVAYRPLLINMFSTVISTAST